MKRIISKVKKWKDNFKTNKSDILESLYASTCVAHLLYAQPAAHYYFIKTTIFAIGSNFRL